MTNRRLTRSSGEDDVYLLELPDPVAQKKKQPKSKPKPKPASGKEAKAEEAPVPVSDAAAAASASAGTKRKADEPEAEGSPAAKKPRIEGKTLQALQDAGLHASVARDLDQQFGAGSEEYKAAPGNEFRIFGAPKCIEELRTSLHNALGRVMGPGARTDIEAAVIFDLMHTSRCFNELETKITKLSDQKLDFQIIEEKVAELTKENERFFSEITQLRRLFAGNFQPRPDDRIPAVGQESKRRHKLKPGDYIVPGRLFTNSRPSSEDMGLLSASICRFIAQHKVCIKCWSLGHGFSDNLDEEHKSTSAPEDVTFVETLSGGLVAWFGNDFFHADLLTSSQCYQLTNHLGWLAHGDRCTQSPIIRSALGKSGFWMLDVDFKDLQDTTDRECRLWAATAIVRHKLGEILKKPYTLTREEYRRQLSMRAKEPAVFGHRQAIGPT